MAHSHFSFSAWMLGLSEAQIGALEKRGLQVDGIGLCTDVYVEVSLRDWIDRRIGTAPTFCAAVHVADSALAAAR